MTLSELIEPDWPIEPYPDLPDSVRLALEDNLTHRLWVGVGLSSGDTSNSAYDWKLINALVDRRIRDERAVMTAVIRRPCYALESPNTHKITRTIRKVISKAVEREAQRPRVEKIVIYQSDSPIYEVHTPMGCVGMSMATLMSTHKFAVRYAEAFRVVPLLPKSRVEWLAQVNDWLDKAEVVEQPEEASEDGYERDIIEDFVEGMAQGIEGDDLERGAKMDHPTEQGKVVKMSALVQLLRQKLPKLTPRKAALHLRKLGWKPTTVRIGKPRRVWFRRYAHAETNDG